MILKARQL